MVKIVNFMLFYLSQLNLKQTCVAYANEGKRETIRGMHGQELLKGWLYCELSLGRNVVPAPFPVIFSQVKELPQKQATS